MRLKRHLILTVATLLPLVGCLPQAPALPANQVLATKPAPPIILRVMADGTVLFDGEAMALDKLDQRLSSMAERGDMTEIHLQLAPPDPSLDSSKTKELIRLLMKYPSLRIVIVGKTR